MTFGTFADRKVAASVVETITRAVSRPGGLITAMPGTD
jgi:hypothetical protein